MSVRIFWVHTMECMCVHRLDLGLSSHPKEFLGNGVRTIVNPKRKIPSTGKKSPQRRIEPTTLHQAGQRAQHTTNELFRPRNQLLSAKFTFTSGVRTPWEQSPPPEKFSSEEIKQDREPNTLPTSYSGPREMLTDEANTEADRDRVRPFNTGLCLVAATYQLTIAGHCRTTWGRCHEGRRPSGDDSLHSPTVIPPSPPDKPSIMKRYHRRRTTRWGVTARSLTMVTLRDTRFVECRWWNDG